MDDNCHNSFIYCFVPYDAAHKIILKSVGACWKKARMCVFKKRGQKSITETAVNIYMQYTWDFK